MEKSGLAALSIYKEQKNWSVHETVSTGLTASEWIIDMASIDVLSFDRIVNSRTTEFQDMMRGRPLEVVIECRKVRTREKNRLATQRLRQGKADLIVELERKLFEKVREGKEIKEKENQAIETRDGMRREQDRLIDEIVCSQGLDNKIYTIDVASGSCDIVRRVVEPFSQTGGHGLQEDSLREGDNVEWQEYCE